MAEARSRIRRLLRRSAWAVLSLGLFYLIAGNLFLRPAIGSPLINRKPERFEVHWSGAWTVIPGVVHLRDLRLGARAGRGSWRLELEQGKAHIALLDLARRSFRVTALSGSGLVFEAELPADATPGPTSFQPDLLDGKTPPEGPAPPPRGKRPWHILLDEVAVTEVRQVAIGPYLYRGGGTLEGRMNVETRGGPLEVPDLRLELEPGVLEIAGEHAARLDLLKIELQMDPARREERRGRMFLHFLSGRLEASAPETQLSSLGFLFRRVPTMDLRGEGSLHLLAKLDHGVLGPGTTLYVQGDSEVGYLDYTVRGAGEIAGAVTETETGEVQGALDLRFERFELRQDGAPEPHVFGEGATVELTFAALDLAEPTPQIHAVVDIPKSEVPRLAYYNRFLPAESGVKILAGKGTIAARLSLQAPEGTWSGKVTLKGQGLRLRIQKNLVEGNLTLDALLPDGNILERRASLSGTQLKIDRARFLSKDGTPSSGRWWARLEVPRGEMTLANPLALETTFRATIKDTSPLIGLVSKDKKSPRWLRKLLTVESVAGSGEISFQPRRIEARKLAFVAGDHIEVRGHLRLANKDLTALLFCRWRKLSAGVEMEHGQRDWDLVGSRKWFHQKERTWFP